MNCRTYCWDYNLYFFLWRVKPAGYWILLKTDYTIFFFWVCSHVRNCATSRALRQAFALINFWIWTPVGIFPFWIISLNALSTVLRSISVQRRCVCPDRAAGMDFRLLFAAAIFLPCRDRFAVSSASESMMSESITVLSLFNSFFFLTQSSYRQLRCIVILPRRLGQLSSDLIPLRCYCRHRSVKNRLFLELFQVVARFWRCHSVRLVGDKFVCVFYRRGQENSPTPKLHSPTSSTECTSLRHAVGVVCRELYVVHLHRTDQRSVVVIFNPVSIFRRQSEQILVIFRYPSFSTILEN